MASMTQRLNWVPERVRRRRFRLYCVGDGKTGTTTLARKFQHYRSGHEVDAARLVPVANDVLNGSIAPARVRSEIRRRSRRFHLEVDSANFLGPLVGQIVEAHDDSLFVLTIRDCFSWLDSRVEWLSRPQLQMWAENLDARYGRFEDQPAPEEAALANAGLLPIASYLRYWSELPAQVIRAVPSERLCVLRTEDLDTANEQLGSFVGVDPSTILLSHANRNESRTGLLGHVPTEFILDRANELCAPLMQQFWGDDWASLVERLRYER